MTSRPDLVLHFQSLLGAGARQAASEENGEEDGESLHTENWYPLRRKSL